VIPSGGHGGMEEDDTKIGLKEEVRLEVGHCVHSLYIYPVA
jgi:hypothetical protein